MQAVLELEIGARCWCVSVPSEFMSVLANCSYYVCAVPSNNMTDNPPCLVLMDLCHSDEVCPLWSDQILCACVCVYMCVCMCMHVRVGACMHVCSLCVCVDACVCEQQSQMIRSQCQKLLAKFRRLETSLKSSDARFCLFCGNS